MVLRKKIARVLDTISGYFFFAGLITSKIKLLPFFILTPFFNLFSLVASLIGYITWQLAALFLPPHPKKHKHWYGFASLKNQYQLASFLGMVATVLCIAYPPFIIPTLWIYSISNFFWLVAEYHKKEHPPLHDETYSKIKQAYYLHYAGWITAATLLTTLLATTAFFLPTIAFPLLLATGIIGGLITLIAFGYWGKSTFTKEQPAQIVGDKDEGVENDSPLYTNTNRATLKEIELAPLNKPEAPASTYIHSALMTVGMFSEQSRSSPATTTKPPCLDLKIPV